MKKVVIILNGTGGSGKGEFAKFLNMFKNTLTISSVDKVKEAAEVFGWNGSKDEKSRKFLSDLKILATEYNDAPFNYISERVKRFKDKLCDYQILTIDIREPEEVARAVKEFDAITVLVKRKSVPNIESNMADANVDKYKYDYVFYNDGTLDDLKNDVEEFVNKLFKSR